MDKKTKKAANSKFKTSLKEFFRKLLVSLKKKPDIIPLGLLLITFLIFSLNLTDISNTTSKIQGPNMGLSEFVAMLLSILSMICLLNAFPKRQKPNKMMIIVYLILFAVTVWADINYISCINASSIKINAATAYITKTKGIIIAHIIGMSLTTVAVFLEPVIAKLLKKINTSVEIEETEVGEIELAEEE
ncbi:MAG: hypothetical protein IKM40_02850 [Clostridia bacterium]|nr:hypothetical protein [Clostridia bacterium]